MTTAPPVTTTADNRRRQYVPLYVHFAGGETGQRILSHFGVAGLGVWAATLAAAKRSRDQGTLEWYSDADAWSQLGLSAHPPDFTFDDFVRFLGRFKLASTTRSGEVRKTSITAWEAWNNVIRRDQDAAKKRRKRAQNTGDNTGDDMSTIRGTEGEGEGEYPPTPTKGRKSSRASGTSPRQRGTSPRAGQATPEPHRDPQADYPHACRFCTQRRLTQREIDEHTLNVHEHRLTPDEITQLRARHEETP